MDDGRKLIFISWNIFQFEIILPMECHHFPRCTIHCHWRRGMRQLSPVDIAIFIQNLWRYLCDCDPLGAFSRQRWAPVSNERGMSPASQIKHSNSWPENLQCWPQSDDDGCYQHLSAPGLLLLISEWPKLQLPRALQTAEITRTNTANEQTRGNLGQSFVIQRQD